MRRNLGIAIEQIQPLEVDPYFHDVIPAGDAEMVALEGIVGDIKNWFRGKIDLKFKEGPSFDRNVEKATQIRERLKHKGDIKKGKEKLETRLYVEDLYCDGKFITDFDSLKKLFAEQKTFFTKLFNDIEPAAKELVTKYKEAMKVSATDLNKAHQILMDYPGLYLPSSYKGMAKNKLSNQVSSTDHFFGTVCLKLYTNEDQLYFTVTNIEKRFDYPKQVFTLTKEECLEALNIITDFQKTLFDLYVKIWDGCLKDYHTSLNAFGKEHSDWKKLPHDEQETIGKIADIVYEITTDFKPLYNLAGALLNATRSAQYYLVYSMENLENVS